MSTLTDRYVEATAASYSDRPLHLVGPAVYVDYIRVLTALLATVVPIVTVVVAAVNAFDGAPFGKILGAAFGAAITTSAHIAVWVTVFFVILDRTGARFSATESWTPASLPSPPSRRARYGELIAESLLAVLFSALILVSPNLSLERNAEGDPIPVLDPWLWDTGIVYVFVGLVVASLGLSFARHYTKWRPPVVAIGAVAQLAPMVLLIWLAANDHVINPAFIESVGWPQAATRWIGPGLIIGAVGAIVSTIFETIRRASLER